MKNKIIMVIILFTTLIIVACNSQPENQSVANDYVLVEYTETESESKALEKEYTQKYQLLDTHPVFTTTMRIHEYMPEFTFIRTLGDFVTDFYMIEEERYVSITILDESSNIIQEIDGIMQGGHGLWMVPEHEMFEIRFDDFNFDGYMDMWLITARNPGTAGGEWGYHWIWNPNTGQFELNEQLNQINACMSWLYVNQDTQQIQISSRGGGGGSWLTSYYEWFEDELILIAEMFTEWIHRDFVPSYILTTHRDFVTGEIIIVSDPPNSLPDYVITKTVDINPDMPFPTHEVKLEMWRLPEDSEYRMDGYQYEIAILITGQRQTDFGISPTWQTIRGLRAGYGYGRWIEIDPANPLNLHFVDFNGNGYIDMALRRFPPQTGGMADDAHYFWLWNPDASSWSPSF